VNNYHQPVYNKNPHADTTASHTQLPEAYIAHEEEEVRNEKHDLISKYLAVIALRIIRNCNVS